MLEKKRFESDFKRLYKPLCMYAMHYIHDMDIAQDIVEDCFVSVLQKGLPAENSVASYMHVAVRNRAIDYLRRKKFECLQAPGQIEEYDYFTDDMDDDIFDGSQEESRIWEALDRLPEKRRQIFILSRRDGLSHEEIAKELGLSTRTVKNQISRALATFDQKIFTKILSFFY